MSIEVLGIDIAKNVFQLHGVNRGGGVESRPCYEQGPPGQ